MPDGYKDENDVFAAATARKRAIADQLARRPVEHVLGLVDPSGPGGWPEENDHWTLSFKFHNWKIPPGVLKTRPMSISMTGTRKRFDSLWERIESYSVVGIRARIVEESVIGTCEAQLIEFLGPDKSDSDLIQAAHDLQKPVIHLDHDFGPCTLDRRSNWYAAKAMWNGTAVEVNLKSDVEGNPNSALEVARILWIDQSAWSKRIEDYAVQKLLPIKNEYWLDEDESELTPDQFKTRMNLESITVEPNGSFDYWYDDGDLFSGHSIQVSGSLKDGPTDAGIQG